MKNKTVITILFVVLAGLITTTSFFSQEPELIKKIRENNIDAVKELLTSGTTINLNQEYEILNLTPLELAMMNNNPEMAKLLIEAGADVNYKNYLASACFNKRTDIVKLLLARDTDLTTENKNYGIVYTPLGHALSDVEIAKLLISEEADVNIKDSKGRTALSLAEEYEYTEMVKLLKAGGKITLKIYRYDLYNCNCSPFTTADCRALQLTRPEEK